MIYDTEIFETTDVAGFKVVLDSYRDALVAMGARDIKLLRSVAEPGKLFLTMWWPTVEACRAFGERYHGEIGAKIGPITTSMQPDVLWTEV